MRYPPEHLRRLESVMNDASRGLRAVGVTKQVSEDLRTLEYIISVIRLAGCPSPESEEDRRAALETIYDGLFR